MRKLINRRAGFSFTAALLVLLLSPLAQGQPEADVATEGEGDGRVLTLPIQLAGGVGEAYVEHGEDMAIGAFRFCEDYKVEDVALALEVTKKLQAKMPSDYQIPKEFVLKTAMRYVRAAKELVKDGFYDEAGHCVLRALLRPGLDDATRAKLLPHLERAFKHLSLQRKREDKEREQAEQLEARQLIEEEAAKEAEAERERDEDDWKAFARQRIVEEDAEVESLLSLKVAAGEQKEETALHLREGQDAAEAVVHFCAANMISGADTVTRLHTALHREAAKKGVDSVGTPLGDIRDYLERARKHAEKAQFLSAAMDCTRGLHFLSILGDTEDEAVLDAREQYNLQLQSLLDECLQKQRHIRDFETFYLSGEWEAATEALAKVREASADDHLMLMRARCYQQLGKWSACAREVGYLIPRLASYTAWKRGQPRMMAVRLGAQAAMELGQVDKALRFYKTVLKHDPEQKQIRKLYKQLKKIVSTMVEVDELLEKSANHKAVEVLEDALSLLRGMKSSSVMFRSSVLLKLCRAQSAMRLHEQALAACDTAVERQRTPVPGMRFVDNTKLAEALKIRARAHLNDDNADAAVSDLRQALALVEGRQTEENEVNTLLREATHAARMWKERRDQAAVLKLPANLRELPREKQCTWVKKQYKSLAKKWHPDKYRGDKKRAERKMREVVEAKESLSGDLQCGRIR